MEAFEEVDEYIEENDEEYNEKRGSLAGWGISLCVHALALIILATVIIAAKVVVERPPTRLVQIEMPPEPPKEKPKRELVEVDEVEIVHDEEVTNEITLITELDEISEIELTSEDPVDAKEIRGREDAVSDTELASNGAFKMIGAGGGGAGAFGRKIGGDKTRIGKAYGPNARAATSALDRALRWLMIHQSPNGQWDSDAYNMNCNDNPKCEPGKTVNGADEALTGYAVACFLGAGYDHKVMSKYRKTVKKGIEWLVSQQNAEGVIGRRNYEHPIATMALAEAYAMSMDQNLREPVQKAVNVILSRQVKSDDDQDYSGLGWDYVSPKISRMDSSVSGWNVMALKSAKAAGIDVSNGLHGSKNWLKGAWEAANPGWEQLDPYGTSVFPYTWNGASGATKKEHLSFVGSLCAVFLGSRSGDVMLDTLTNDMDKRWFDNEKYKKNSYCLYYASLASFQAGGAHWTEKWGHPENGYVPWLIQTQMTEGCQDGTWPHENENWHGWDTSPVLTHAYKTLALEVAFRYLPMSAK